MIVLIHTSKTMRTSSPGATPAGSPALLDQAEKLVGHVRTLSAKQLAKVMTISAPLAEKTRELFASWSTESADLTPAVECFTGDIYSGLQVSTFSAADRRHAGKHLRILSGLYGILRPFDGISPYRLEMGYRLPGIAFSNLYAFWGRTIADQLPRSGPIVNLAAAEYSRTVLPFVDPDRVVTPKFRTVDPKSGEPRFVVVHAKIARGAFARWLITERIRDSDEALGFDRLGYRRDPADSTPREPSFICTEFEGKGLSVRLS